MAENTIIKKDDIQSRIYTIRNVQIMLDSDLAELYGVEVKRLNEQVKRNIERFPQEFSFQLTAEENNALRSQFVEVILLLVEIEKVAPLWNNPQNPITIKKGATNESKHD